MNDIWGHAAGDEVLRITAERLQRIRQRTGRRLAHRRRRIRRDRRGRRHPFDAPARGQHSRGAWRTLRNRGQHDHARREHRRCALPDQRRERQRALPRRRQRPLQGEGPGPQLARRLRHRDEREDAAERCARARSAPGARAATSSSSSISRSSSSHRGGCAATRRSSAGNGPARAFFRRATSWPSPRKPGSSFRSAIGCCARHARTPRRGSIRAPLP